MGLFDLPAPLFDFVDAILAACLLPPVARIVIHAFAFAVVGMLVYRRFSQQSRLAELRVELSATQRQLAGYDGDFAGLRTLIRRSMAMALRQVALTFWPAMLASVPLLFVLPWLSNRFAESEPVAGAAIEVCVIPPAAMDRLSWHPSGFAEVLQDGCWNVNWPASGASVELRDPAGAGLRLPLPALTPVVHKRGWMNVLFGNPGGDLDESASFDALVLNLPAREIIAFGPHWMRGWMFVFFVPLFLVSLGLKMRWRLH